MKVKITLDDGEKKDIVDKIIMINSKLESNKIDEKKHRREMRNILSNAFGQQVVEKVREEMLILQDELHKEIYK